MRWLAVYLPQLPLEPPVLSASATPGSPPPRSHQPGPAVIVTAGQPPRVKRACARAIRQGLQPGMTLSAARAQLPELIVRREDPVGVQTALERLAVWAGQFTSTLHLVEGAGLLLDVAGSLRLFGGLKPLLRQVRHGMRRLGYRTVHLGVAPTSQGAWLLARAGGQSPVLHRRDLRDRIAGLPITALDVADAQHAQLVGVGMHTLGDLLALPRGGVKKRFGAAGVEQLDRALGIRPDPRPPFMPPEHFATTLTLPVEVDDTRVIRFALRRMLMELAGFLTARGDGVETVTLSLNHPQGAATPVTLTRISLTRDDRHLRTLFAERLERLTLSQPVIALALTTGATRQLSAHALDLFGRTPPDADAHLLERFRARLGETAVTGIHGVPEHRPERAWQPGPPSPTPGHRPGPLAMPLRPLWLLPRPLPLAVQNGMPCRSGPLTLTAGPERIASGWWDGDDVTRDYYRARHATRGGGYWVFRDRNGSWFLHGLFA